MVNPGGTGSSSTDVISARLAPLPPRRSLSSIGERGCAWSKSKTYRIGPPCPGRADRRGDTVAGGSLPISIWDGNASLVSLGRLTLRRLGRVFMLVALDRAVHGALEHLFGLAHVVEHDGELVGLEAHRDLTHPLGDRLLQTGEALLSLGHDLHPDPAPVLGVAS